MPMYHESLLKILIFLKWLFMTLLSFFAYHARIVHHDGDVLVGLYPACVDVKKDLFRFLE